MTNKTFEFTTEIDIQAAPEVVYRFFTESDLVKRWHGVDADCDPRPGGIFLLNVTGVHLKVGQFVELDPPHRIVFTWGHPEGVDNFPPGSSTVEIRFEPISTGTRLHLRHHHFPTATHRNEHRVGWSHYLGRLSNVAAGIDPGPDPWRRV